MHAVTRIISLAFEGDFKTPRHRSLALTAYYTFLHPKVNYYPYNARYFSAILVSFSSAVRWGFHAAFLSTQPYYGGEGVQSCEYHSERHTGFRAYCWFGRDILLQPHD
jgi:hypothetical protein